MLCQLCACGHLHCPLCCEALVYTEHPGLGNSLQYIAAFTGNDPAASSAYPPRLLHSFLLNGVNSHVGPDTAKCILQVIHSVAQLAQEHADVAMLARTHGQTASPTTLGKELAVFAYRLQRQRQQVCAVLHLICPFQSGTLMAKQPCYAACQLPHTCVQQTCIMKASTRARCRCRYSGMCTAHASQASLLLSLHHHQTIASHVRGVLCKESRSLHQSWSS